MVTSTGASPRTWREDVGLAGALVELHGQHDDRGLVNPRGHRALLDRYANADVAGVAAAWDDWRGAREKLAEAREAVETAKADQDLLLAHLSELTALEPKAGEEARLAETRADMQKGEKLSGDLEELRHLWEGSESPLAALRVAARRLDRIAPEHPLLAEALASLDRAVIEAGEAEDRLASAAEALVHDPAALEAAETRLFEETAIIPLLHERAHWMVSARVTGTRSDVQPMLWRELALQPV